MEQARTALLGCIAFVYSGGATYLGRYGSDLPLYAFYLVIISLVIYCASSDDFFFRRLKDLRPYAVWYLIFSIWICAVGIGSSLPPAAASLVVRDIIKATILFPAMVATIPGPAHLRRFANAIAAVLLLNAIISFLIPISPRLFAFIRSSDDLGEMTRFVQIARSTGLWGNANQAAHAFLFGAILGLWANPFWRRIAFASAVVGIFLSASRQGVYLLTFCATVGIIASIPVAIKARSQPALIQLSAALGALILFIAVSIGSSANIDFSNAPGFRNISRVLDYRETRSTVSRSAVAELAFRQIAKSPIIGSGPYSIRKYLIRYGAGGQDTGAHNIYLAIAGEGGLVALVAYLGVMIAGFARIRRSRGPSTQKVGLHLFWLSYMAIGLTWHGQMGNFNGIVYAALLFLLPRASHAPIDTFRGKRRTTPDL